MADAEQEAVGGANTVRGLVKRFDQDRYLSALYAPKAVQDDLLALYGFNIELSRVSLQVSEAMFGEVRLRWWRDFLELSSEGGSAARSGNPVADALIEARRVHSLPEDLLARMIDARAFDLNRDPMADMPALQAYLSYTGASLFELACNILGVRGEAAAEASAHAAAAWGLTGMMRNLPLHSTRGQVFLPAAQLEAHGVSLRSLTRGEETINLAPALKSLRASARRSLEMFRRAAQALPPEAAPAFLHLALVEPYLAGLAASNHRPLHDVADINPLRRYWRIVRASARGRV
jgi:15-cis-phytoene synthase